jgi:hypothetical protein
VHKSLTASVAALLSCLASANPVVFPDHPPLLLLAAPGPLQLSMGGVVADPAAGVVGASVNPAALAGLKHPEVALVGGRWETGDWPDGSLWWAAFGAPVGKRLTIGADLTAAYRGETNVVNRHEEPVGTMPVLDAALAGRAAYAIDDDWSAGLALRGFLSNLPENYDWMGPPRDDVLALGLLADAGVRWTPNRRLGVGLSLGNAGSDIEYRSTTSDWVYLTAAAPWTVRLGGRWRAVELWPVRIDVLAGLSTLLVGDEWSTGAEPLLADAWYSTARDLTVEVVLWDAIYLRAGHINDPTTDRRGLCWGAGVGYRGILRFDLGSDAAASEYGSRDWSLGVTVSDPATLLRRP